MWLQNAPIVDYIFIEKTEENDNEIPIKKIVSNNFRNIKWKTGEKA